MSSGACCAWYDEAARVRWIIENGVDYGRLEIYDHSSQALLATIDMKREQPYSYWGTGTVFNTGTAGRARLMCEYGSMLMDVNYGEGQGHGLWLASPHLMVGSTIAIPHVHITPPGDQR